MLLAEIATASEDVRATSARGAKVARLVQCLAALTPDEVPAGVAYLSGRLLQRQTGAGWAALRELPPPGAASTLTVLEVDAAFARMAALAAPDRSQRDGIWCTTCSPGRASRSSASCAV
jgi:DNA ligase-1